MRASRRAPRAAEPRAARPRRRRRACESGSLRRLAARRGNDVHDAAAVVAEVGARHALHVFGGDGGNRPSRRSSTERMRPKLTYSRAMRLAFSLAVSMPESRSTSIWRFTFASSAGDTRSSRSRWISAMKRRSTSSDVAAGPHARERVEESGVLQFPVRAVRAERLLLVVDELPVEAASCVRRRARGLATSSASASG